MFGIGHFKGDPSKHTIRYSAGKVVAQGAGLSFFYMRYNTQVAAVPTNSADSNFVFNESTNNFQSVTIQGQFTYRITNPTLIAGSVVGRNNFCQLDFSGRRGQRSLSVQIRDAQGQIAWSRAIAEQELR